MLAEFDIKMPERHDGEVDVTVTQKGYLIHLFHTVGVEQASFDVEKLGKWQAAALIDQLIEIRDNREESEALVGYQGEVSGSAKTTMPEEPFFETITGQVIKVLLIFIAIFVGWILILR